MLYICQIADFGEKIDQFWVQSSLAINVTEINIAFCRKYM